MENQKDKKIVSVLNRVIDANGSLYVENFWSHMVAGTSIEAFQLSV